MIERISSLGPAASVSSVKSGENGAARSTSNTRTSTGSASLPKLINLARELAEQGPPVDYAKIAHVRQAIAQGSYQIDADALANAILLYAGKGDQ